MAIERATSGAERAAIWKRGLRFLLRPVARFCIHHALTLNDLIELLKEVLVEVGNEELRRSGRKVNASRISVLTGVDRKAVKRLTGEERPVTISDPTNIAMRVMGQWEQMPRFASKGKVPRVLTYKGEKSEFRELVETISTNINPGTVLAQLVQQGIVAKTNRGAKLVKQEQRFNMDPEKYFDMLAKEVETLLRTVESNLLSQSELRNLHLRTEYDNVYKEDLPAIKAWLLEEGKSSHRRAREFLSQFDKDVSVDVNKEGGARVVMTTFSLTLEEG